MKWIKALFSGNRVNTHISKNNTINIIANNTIAMERLSNAVELLEKSLRSLEARVEALEIKALKP